MNDSYSGIPSGLPPGSIQFGGPVDRWAVALRVYGPAVDPAAITDLFGVQPTTAHARGAPFPSGIKARVGLWYFEVQSDDPSERDPNVLVRLLLQAFPSDSAVWAAAAIHRPDVLCGLFLDSQNRGLVLEAETVALLASRGLSLSMDIYAPEPSAA